MFAVYLLKSEAAGEMANSALLLLINDAGLTFLLCSRCVMGENKVPVCPFRGRGIRFGRSGDGGARKARVEECGECPGVHIDILNG